MRSNFVALITLNCILSHCIVLGFPTGAGSCASGVAVGAPHSTSGQGDIGKGGYEILFDSTPLSETSLNKFVGGTHLVTLRADNNFFRGFLMRLDTKGESNLDFPNPGFTLSGDQSNSVQLLGKDPNFLGVSCPTGVAGATHTEKSDKTSIEVTFMWNIFSKLDLEVTVVKANDIELGRDQWYHSTFSIEVIQETTEPSPLPSFQPIQRPDNRPSTAPNAFVSGKPSMNNTESFSEFPTESPIDSKIAEPSLTPTGIPSPRSVQPTSKPSRSVQPTSKPSKIEIKNPTRKPTSNPTRKPISPNNPIPICRKSNFLKILDRFLEKSHDEKVYQK